MNSDTVAIVETGTCNLASVQSAFTRLGVGTEIVRDKAQLMRAKRIVLPGVGSFEAAMGTLRDRELVDALCDKIASGYPTLAICLGMQLLFESSEESDGVDGLGIMPGRITRISESIRVPHLGWNWVEADNTVCLQSGYAYFAHSFRMSALSATSSVARTRYGSEFTAGFESGGVVACQFHPELSGQWGRALIERWLRKEVIC